MDKMNEWTDRQKEEYNRLTEEYFDHPVCAKCGKPIEKKVQVMNSPAELTHKMVISCPVCGPLWTYGISTGILISNGCTIDSDTNLDMFWANYADYLAKKAHPDWWDFKKMLPVRKEDF